VEIISPSNSINVSFVRIAVSKPFHVNSFTLRVEQAGYNRPIYADTTRALFKEFGLIENLEVTPANQKVKSYLTGKSRLANVLSSIWVSLQLKTQGLLRIYWHVWHISADLCRTPSTSANKVISLSWEENLFSGQVKGLLILLCPSSHIIIIARCPMPICISHAPYWRSYVFCMGYGGSCAYITVTDTEVAELMAAAGVEFPAQATRKPGLAWESFSIATKNVVTQRAVLQVYHHIGKYIQTTM
jgi:hypothetical protein